jgi:hypothetical protein
MKEPVPPECQTQGALAQLIDLTITPGWVWTSSAVGGFRRSARLNAMRLKAGRSDLQLLDPNGRFHGLELKRKGKGRVRPAQEAFRQHCVAHAIPYAVADTDDEAISILRGWGAIRGVRG